MSEIIISLSIVLIFLILFLLSRKLTQKRFGIVLKVVSILIFCVYFYRLFHYDQINYIEKFIGFLAPARLITINILRWLTMACLIVTILTPFLRVVTLKNIVALILPIVVVLDVVFYRLFILSILGPKEFSLLNAVSITFAVELALMGGVSFYYLYEKIKAKEFENFKPQIKYLLICFPLIMLMVFPENILINFFGEAGVTAQNFEFGHRVYVYISILSPILITFFARNKGENVRWAILCLFALSGFTQYFYTFTFNTGVTGLPFHLCNTAILLIFVSYLFRSKPFFYFNYLVNVVGSLFAILLPNCATDIISVNTLQFWFNHWYAFFVPILGVSLNIFKRPTFKFVRWAIYIFSAYLVFAAVLNAWLANFNPDVDYFFLNKNFIVGKFPFLFNIKQNFVLSFNVSNLVFNIYWLYDLIIYFAYILMIFLTWIVYVYIYKVTDHYANVIELRRIDVLEIQKLKKEMQGRVLSEPLKKGADVIEIKNFSKKYGGSKDFAVRDFSLNVKPGEVFGFLGHNGSGKSTTIKSLIGVQSITDGQILICGYDIVRQPLQAKQNIGYVSDNHAVYEHLTGREYVNYVANLYGISQSERDEKIKKYVDMFNLTDAFDREIKGYSHGMKQKIMVISSLVHNPKVWVLDEPLTGLDPVSSYQIKECMKEHAKKGNVVFFSSHVIEVVEKVCDKIAIIKKGELQGVYKLKELKEKGQSLEKLYMSFSGEKEIRGRKRKEAKCSKD